MPGYFDGDPVTSIELITLFRLILGTPMLRPKPLTINIRLGGLDRPDRGWSVLIFRDMKFERLS